MTPSRFITLGLAITAASAFAQTTESPFLGTPAQVPGIIQSANFDNGGEGVAYHSSLSTNTGNYRQTTMPILPSGDTNGGYQILMTTGDWAKYTVAASSPGLYNLRLRLLLPTTASQSANWNSFAATVHVETDGFDQTGPLTIFGVPGSQTGQPIWQILAAEQLIFRATNQVVRVVVDQCYGLTPTPTLGLSLLQLTPAGSAMPVQILAGSLTPGFADGTGVTAQFSTNITGLGVDVGGNLYVADAGNLRIRRITPSGDVSTFSGNGTAGTNDGPGASAQFAHMAGVGNILAVDDATNCYVLDRGALWDFPRNNTVRRISPQGTVSTPLQELDLNWADSLALKRSGEVTIGFNWQGIPTGPVIPTGYEVLQFAADGSTNLLASGVDTAPLSGSVIIDLATGFTTNLFCLYSSGLPSWIKVVQFSSPTNVNVHYDPNAGRPSPTDFFRGFTLSRAGQFYFIWADFHGMYPVPGDTTLRHGAVKTLDGYGFLQTMFFAQGLGPRIAVDTQTNVYCIQSNRVVKLVNYPGLTLVAQTDGGGTVTVDPGGPYFTNAVVTVTETNWPGLSFLGWAHDATGLSSTLQFTMTNHVRLKAVYGAPINISVTNATVQRTPDLPVYPYGTQVQLVIHPNLGFGLQSWSDGTRGLTNVVVVTNQITLQATLVALPTYTVSAAALGGIGGSVQVSPSQGQYFQGTAVVLTAVPTPGYDFQTWLDNVLTNPRTLVVTSNTALFAAFAPQAGPATIVTPPSDTNVVVGTPVEFSVAAKGAPPLQIQWQFNSTNLAGATNALLILPQAQLSDAGTYTVTVTNNSGSASASAKLTVHAATGIRFDAFTRTGNGQLACTVEGPVGGSLRVETSTDLQGWSAVTSLQNTYGVVQFNVSADATATAKFYRVVQVSGP